MTSDMFWEILNYAMAVVFPAVLLLEVYSSVRHRITHGAWPSTARESEWAAEIDRDMRKTRDRANPAIPGTPAYESAFAREMGQDMEDAYRNMNPL